MTRLLTIPTEQQTISERHISTELTICVERRFHLDTNLKCMKIRISAEIPDTLCNLFAYFLKKTWQGKNNGSKSRRRLLSICPAFGFPRDIWLATIESRMLDWIGLWFDPAVHLFMQGECSRDLEQARHSILWYLEVGQGKSMWFPPDVVGFHFHQS